jgi:hypothetical protein
MDYMPKKEADKKIWYGNLSTQVATNAAALGFTAAQVTNVQNVCAANMLAIGNCDTAQTAAKTAKAVKDTQLANGDKVLRAEIKKMKAAAGYTEGIGTALKVIGDDSAANDFANRKPSINCMVMPGRVRINFVKGDLDGVNIYTRLKGQTTWTKLALDTHSPYEDNRPLAVANQPEHREFMAIGVLQDEEVTQQSDIIEAVFGG